MDITRNFGFLIKDISRLYTRLFQQRLRHMDVTLEQCKVLARLSRNEGISQVRLAELSGIEPMTLVRILDRMEGDDWIERRPHPTDRRARQLYLKQKAQPILELIWKVSDAVRAEAFAGFKAQERNLLIELLSRAHDNLIATKADEARVEDPPASRAAVSRTPNSRATKPRSAR